MGLFSFLKNAGAKLFGGTDEAPLEKKDNSQVTAALVAMVERMGLKVNNLNIQFNGASATVSGEAHTQQDKEKIILTVGNVEGVETVDDQMTVVQTETPEPEATFHTVEKGDTLSKIAKHVYGDAMKYPIIFEANKPMLTSPDLIYPGQVLRIPAL